MISYKLTKKTKKVIKKKENKTKKVKKTVKKTKKVIKKSNKNNKKCSLNETDKILFGDGGSTAIIVINKDKKAYKFFTLYNFILDTKLPKKIKDNNIMVLNEIKIYELITKNIINENISNHFVKYIKSHSCNNAKSLFKKCPSYVEYLKLSKDQKSKMCKNYFKGYPNRVINDDYKVIEIEYCDYSSADFIKDVSKLPEIEMEKYLDIFFFQIIYTILSTQKIYPYFVHNDLFMRNILGLREKDNGNYYTYKFNDKTFNIPQKKFYPKINDFGMTNLNDKYSDVKLFKSLYKDIYCIIFDVYNGGNLGSVSLTELCKENPDKLKFLKLYFSNYFNVNIIDEYREKSINEMNWNWNNTIDDEFLKSIEMKNPNDLLNNYFHNIFGKINEKI